MMGRTPSWVKRLSWSVPVSRSVSPEPRDPDCAEEASGAIAAIVDSAPVFLSTSRRVSRNFGKAHIDNLQSKVVRQPLDVGDQIDFDQGIAGNTAGGGDGGADGRNVAEAAFVDGVHPFPVLDVVQIHIHLENLVHRGTRADQGFFQLVKNMLGVLFDRPLKMRAYPGQEEHIAVGDGAAEQRRLAVLGRRAPSFFLGRRRPRLRSGGENGPTTQGSSGGGGVFQDGS